MYGQTRKLEINWFPIDSNLVYSISRKMIVEK
jgi:hypothetical protein